MEKERIESTGRRSKMVKRWSSGKFVIGVEEDGEVDDGDGFLVDSAAMRGNRRKIDSSLELLGMICCIVTVSLLHGKKKSNLLFFLIKMPAKISNF